MDFKIKNTLDIILQSLDIIVDSRLWKDKKPSEILRILIYLHNKGWLYTPKVDNRVIAVIGAYRVNGDSDEILSKIPKEEEGNKLYIPFAILLNKEDNIYRVARESLRQYLSENTDIEEILLEDKKDKLKRYKIGDGNGKISRA